MDVHDAQIYTTNQQTHEEYDVEDIFDLSFVPENTPLYLILTGGSGGVKSDMTFNYHFSILLIVGAYIETGIIDIIGLFEEGSDVDIDELKDAFQYLLGLYKPDNFPVQYWFATLVDNWILEQHSKGNTPDDNRWLIDITDMAYKMYAYPLSIVNNPDYVIAGSYPLSLINPRVNPGDIDVFYVGDDEYLSAGDDLFVQVRKPFLTDDVESVEDVCNTRYHRSCDIYFQYNDGTTICHTSDDVIDVDKTRLLNWQFILKKYPSAAHVLASFDIDCCKVCLIGTRLFATPCGYYAIKNNTVKVANNATGYNSLFRMYKYVNRRDYDVLSVGDDYELDEDECYNLPDVVRKEDYYGYKFSYREFDQLIHIIAEFYNGNDDKIYGYDNMEPVNEKYLPLTQVHVNMTNMIWFMLINSRIRVFFHPLLKTSDDIKEAVRHLHMFTPELIELAYELIDNYNWLMETQEPRLPVDFTWYVNNDLCRQSE